MRVENADQFPGFVDEIEDAFEPAMHPKRPPVGRFKARLDSRERSDGFNRKMNESHDSPERAGSDDMPID